MNSFTSKILPPATIGIIGGGQLGQMMTLAAKSMGYKVGILDPTPDSSASQVADFQIVAEYTDQDALRELAEKSDVLTYEFENVDQTNLQRVAHLTHIPQHIDELIISSNRLREKNFLTENNLPVTPYARVTDQESLERAILLVGFPGILKTTEGGYDGHGQFDLNSEADIQTVLPELEKTEWIFEKRQNFVKEVSIMVTGDFTGKIQTFPVSENTHRDHILHTSVVPANLSDKVHQKAADIAERIADSLALSGVLGIEFFVLKNDQLLVNELAPRPHNSGHYTIEACNISQFEAHIRSICGLELPQITLNQHAVMVNLLGDDLTTAREGLVTNPDWHFHDYGKDQIKDKRKMGHITVVGDNAAELLNLIKKFN
ncbi:5-(carboxyamino)imidazole ribonucleotide synthase [Holzapfeliella sp. He02]|uniref:N5-carboxyaminoimidazole ribonucleotide synthase n=1 Tax=Holzapfeliella saturejae TaxID=3082953 RepID=A0ABU8SHI5_9LACO